MQPKYVHNPKDPILVDISSRTLFVNHIGYTMRVLLSAAIKACYEHKVSGSQTFFVSFQNNIIGSVKLKDEDRSVSRTQPD